MATGAGRPRRTSRFYSSASIVTCSIKIILTNLFASSLLNVGGPDDHEEIQPDGAIYRVSSRQKAKQRMLTKQVLTSAS